MTLDNNGILKILVNNPNKDIIQKGRDVHKKLKLHMYGQGLEENITHIDGHEKDELLSIRKKYAKSNKALFERLARPIDKVFSAKGGSIYYNLNESDTKKINQIVNSYDGGNTLKQVLKDKWVPHLLDDPMGVILMEIGDEPDEFGNIIPFTTYKSINVIYDYKLSGLRLEYLVFKLDESKKLKYGYKKEDDVYRVIDDVKDYIVKLNPEKSAITINEEFTYDNFFGVVPGFVNSDISDSELNGLRNSLFDVVIDDADDYMQTGSIRNLAKIRLAYPKYWEYADDCHVCKGEGIVEAKKCDKCHGTGKKLMINPGDAKLLAYPDKEDHMITPNVAGFVEFPKTYFDFSSTELSTLENFMSITIWGTESVAQTGGLSTDGVKTATEIISEIQPKADRLSIISDMAEKRHKFLLDRIVSIVVDSSYKGSSVNYGRRYIIEGPDEIWNKYVESRKSGAAISILDDLLLEYIESKYQNDLISLTVQTKLLYIEPFVHNTIAEVKTLGVSEDEYKMKLYFSEWYSSLKEVELIAYSTEELRNKLNEYVSQKTLVEQQ